jgi:hypothetical protein
MRDCSHHTAHPSALGSHLHSRHHPGARFEARMTNSVRIKPQVAGSGLQVHFPQQGWVAQVGAQRIEAGLEV